MLISKQRRLRHFELNAFASLVVIFFVQFKADKVAFFTDGSDGSSAAAHAVVENASPHIGISTDKVLNECYWLLRRVEGIGRMFFIKADNAPWEFFI